MTAQRRAERLQDVPIAISALGSEQLAATGANNVSGLRGLVPGLTISSAASINASNLVSIRGVGGLAVPIGTSQAVGFYVDGVYLSRPDAAFFSLDDVERVEVLRGPQGTLYGRNATAGAINIITREPSRTPAGGFDVNYGNYDAISAKGSLSGPLASGLSAGVSGSYDRHDGYYLNTVTGNHLGRLETYTARGKLRYDAPEGDLSFTLSGDIIRRNGQEVIKNQFTSILPGGVFVGIGDPDETASDALSEAQTLTRLRGGGAALTIVYRPTDELELTSITAFRKINAYTVYDVDGTSLPAVLSALDNHSKTYSEELRAVYSGDRVNLTVGGNYYHGRRQLLQ